MANKKYKVKNTNLLHNDKVYKIGSAIELNDTQAKKLEDILICVGSSESKNSTSKNKTKNETLETKEKTEEVNNDK